jgi:uncharacterized protein (UPF0210 family)
MGSRSGKVCRLLQPANERALYVQAVHGTNRPEVAINVGVSGPGVVVKALECAVTQPGGEGLGLHDLVEVIKRAPFRVTRCRELVGRQVAAELGAPFGVVDLSLALPPDVGDSVASSSSSWASTPSARPARWQSSLCSTTR